MDGDEIIDIPDQDTTCRLCYAEFLDAEDLEIHYTQIHAKKCQLCPTTYTDLLDYALHLRDKHITEMILCRYCSKIFTKKRQWISHTKKHVCHYDSKLFNCSQCSQKYNNKYEVEQHEYECHNNDIDGVILNECFQELSSVLNFNASLFLQSLGTDASFNCVQCKLQTNDVGKYIKHLQKKNCRSYVCFRCCKINRTKKGILRHIRSHKTEKVFDGEIKRTRLCTHCDKEISYLLYSKHRKICKPIKCSKCDVVFKSVHELGTHQAEKHPSLLELKTCKFCRRECVGNEVLQKHIQRTHKGEFPLYKYLCVYCDQPFKHPQRLFGHFYTFHKDLEPYTCKICDKKYRLRKRFTLHIKLQHKSIGFVEFEENYHVFFTDKKSENPFQPYSIFENEGMSISDDNEEPNKSNEPTDNVASVNENSEVLDQAETEGNHTEAEEKVAQKPVKRKQMAKRTVPAKKAKLNMVRNGNESSEDEPLQLLKERKMKRPMKRTIGGKRMRKKHFTCKICNKYCYTYQNYNNHMTLHSRNDKKVCIKCSKTFKSKAALENHIAKDHNSSRLTDTLKYMIEKRKLGMSTLQDLTIQERFRRTIRAVHCKKTVPAKITEVPAGGLSVQKFIESFTPEEVKNDVKIHNNVSIKPISGPYVPKNVIKMTKFKPVVYDAPVRLSLPVKFKQNYLDVVTANIKLVQNNVRNQIHLNFGPERTFELGDDDNIDYDYDDMDLDRGENIPEVAEEVMLENTEENAAVQAPQIIIPHLPKGYKEVQIAHMIPEAPYFKIIKVTADNVDDKEHKAREKKQDVISLPDGTKLVTVNPLAHLLGDKQHELLLPKKRYYKPKPTDFKAVVAKALSKLDEPAKPRVRKTKTVVEQ